MGRRAGSDHRGLGRHAQATPTLIEVTHTSGQGTVTRYQRERTAASAVDRLVTWPDGTTNTATHRPEADSVTYADGTTATTSFGLDERLGLNTRVPVRMEIAIPDGPIAVTTFARSFVPHCVSFSEDCDPNADPALQADQVIDAMTQDGNTWTETYQRAHASGGATIPAAITLQTPLLRESTTTLNGDGLVDAVTVPGIAPLTFGYDARGRLLTMAQTDGATTRATTLSYNAEGFVAAVTDASNRTTGYLYDQVGRVSRQTYPDGRFVEFAYDDAGNLLTLTPPSRPAHGFSYDSLDRGRTYLPPTVPTVPSPRTTFEYDDDHNPVLVTRPDAQTVALSYDPVTGKLASATTPSGSYVYSYDSKTGHLETVTDPEGGSLTYVQQGMLTTRETLAGTVAGDVSWTYDSQLRVVTESINDTHTATTVYDADGVPSQVGHLVLVTDPLNAALTGSWLDNLLGSYAANGFGEQSDAQYVHSGTTVYGLSLVRDEVGRIETKTETRDGVTTLRCYEYDQTGRLTGVYDGADSAGCVGNLLEEYGYDDNGNRIEVANSGVTLTSGQITVDAQDRLLQYGAVTYTYTANGEVDTRTEGASVTDFDYDAAGNLQHVALPGGTQVDYIYDARDRRVGKEVNGTLVQGLLYGDQLNPVAELNGAGAVVSRFVYGMHANVPDYMVDVASGTRYAILSDQLGSVVAVVNATTGVVAQALTYDSWGRVLSDSNPGFQPFGFAGGIYDRDTGWVLFGARDYRPEVGVWAAKDPLGFAAGDANLFRYVVGDPVNFVDPTGRGALDVASNFAAGFGDALTFNITKSIRESMDISSGIVDPCSNSYAAGEYAETAFSFVRGGGIKTLGKALRRSCFAGDTLVETQEGRRPIDQLAVGDLVWARDDASGSEEWKPIVDVMVTPDREVLELTFETQDGSEVVLRVTPEHPLWSLDDGEWDEAGQLDLGEHVDALDGPLRLAAAVAWPTKETVYNFEVADSHTYFVGEAGVWAHNSCMVSARSLLSRQGRSEMTGNRVKSMARKMRDGTFDWGKSGPVKIAERNGMRIIIDGHHRTAAAIRAGIHEVPVQRLAVSDSMWETYVLHVVGR